MGHDDARVSWGRVRRTGRGDFELKLPKEERRILRSLPEQMRTLIREGDASTYRLFPPAYGDDDAAEREYRRMVGNDLLEHHLDALRVLEETLDAKRVDADQLTSWLTALNEVRLVLGTQLDVTEELYDRDVEDADPRAPLFALYFYLGWLQEQVVEALATDLPAEGTSAPDPM